MPSLLKHTLAGVVPNPKTPSQSEKKGVLGALVQRGWMISRSAVEGFIDNNDLLWASALTYTVSLSIVPVLALAFSALKGFGYAERLRPMIEHYVALGSTTTADQLMHYINNVNAAALGSVGGAFLLVTVISTMGTIEQAFNTIFQVPSSRSYIRRFADYLSVLFTVPILLVAALATTTLFSIKILNMPLLGTLTPYLLVWAGLFFLFVFFPYTKVGYGAALFGSFVTALVFQIAQWGYIHFQVGTSHYHAIYGALATIPIFLVWTYLAWSIVLFGAELTAAADRSIAEFLVEPRSPDFPRAAALHLMLRLAEYQVSGGEPVNVEQLALELRSSLDSVQQIVKGLADAGLVVEADAEKTLGERRVYLCRSAGAISLASVVEFGVPTNGQGVVDPRIRKILDIMDHSHQEALSRITLEDLLSKPAAE